MTAEVKEDELAATRMAQQKAEAAAESQAAELEEVRRKAVAKEVELAFMADKCVKATAEAEENAMELKAARKVHFQGAGLMAPWLLRGQFEPP